MAGFFKRLLQRFSRLNVDLDELEESLITGDVGLRMTTQILDRLRAMGRDDDATELRDALKRELREIHLRRRLLHPLLAPELALSFRVG